ncbi:MAG TPA: twin-arginine translocase TatA/TatE family subunit [Acidobacteriaceae bacterium]|nr:twin-arginine translocase TatA/TatE family subunit [Acidobacteriaceae bacterium]
MHFTDYTLILVLALILFGPKKLPEIARQIGKLMVEFRRASNEFKAQIEDELRVLEQQDRQKKLEAAGAQAPALSPPDTESTAGETEETLSRPVVLPPSIGEIVSAAPPNMPVASKELLDAAEVEPHPVYAEALAAENHTATDHPGTGFASGPESGQAPANHG